MVTAVLTPKRKAAIATQTEQYASMVGESVSLPVFKVLPQQQAFLEDTTTPYLGYIAGYGAGKTFSLVRKALILAWLNASNEPKTPVGALYEPTGDLIIEILIPELEALLVEASIPYEARYSSPITYTLSFPHGKCKILLKSFENWRRIVGSNMCFAGVDEIDTVPMAIATKSWQKLTGRVRVGKVNQIFTTSTPEGFHFAYEFFDKNAGDDRRLIRGCTLDNPFLKEDAIANIYSTYSANLIKAYIYGQFVNLTTGSVYPDFSRDRHNSTEQIQQGETLHIGMDFNIGWMSAVALVKRANGYHAVDEFFKLHDTQALCQEIKRRYPQNKLVIYPDASGSQGHSSAAQTDIQIIASYGLQVVVGKTNPAIRDRINSVNAALLNGKGETKLFVNTKKCPNLVRCLEQQAIGPDGKPLKKDNLDHLPDCLGYAVFWIAPVTGGGAFGASRAR